MPEPRCVFMVKPIFRNDDGTPYDDIHLFSYMWNDVHEMAFSANFVAGNCGDSMYLMTNPEKVPLIRLDTGSKTYSD